jgi:DNA primase
VKQTRTHRPWINFKELRARLKFEDVLRHYKVEVRRKGEQHQGPCPLPGHTGSKVAPMFSANLARGIFQCFGCKAKGNILEFSALMEKANIEDGDALRKVAVGLQDRFLPEGASTRKREPTLAAPATPKTLPVLVNEPLDFALKDLAAGHPWFEECGFSVDTVKHFGLGYCSRGFLADRIAIPLHDHSGRLIGYAGRTMDESWISRENPLYLFPAKRERQGRVLDFQRSAFLYNGHRIQAPCDDLVVVSEFHSAWWLHQCGFQAVALMGFECSAEQAKSLVSLVSPSGRLWLMPDGGKDGERLAHALLHGLSPHRFVRWVKLDDGIQPVRLALEKLNQCLRV